MLKTSNKIVLIISAIALASLLAYGFPIVKKRYFPEISQKTQQTKDQAEEKKNDETTNDQNAQENVASQEQTTENSDENLDESDTDQEAVQQEEDFLQILPSDCQKGCKNFDQPEDIQYCKEYCGLTSSSKNPKDCDNFEDLEKDYCLKDEAIKKEDTKICNKISDGGIRRSCINRLTEDIINTPNSNQ